MWDIGGKYDYVAGIRFTRREFHLLFLFFRHYSVRCKANKTLAVASRGKLKAAIVHSRGVNGE